MSETPKKTHFWEKYPNTTLWLIILAVSVVWCWIASQGSKQRLVLLIALGLASFMVGSLTGFIFTSYGEETGTVGKIRDWLVGGLTGLTIANIAGIKSLLLTFSASYAQADVALSASTAIVYATLGFFFMFFQRELILNVLLAQGRAKRGLVEGTRQAGQIMQQFLVALPASILSGVDDIDELLTFQKEKAQQLRDLIYSGDVQKFLDEAEAAQKIGANLDWDIASKVANLLYYRTYFEKEENKSAQAARAHEWILRALSMNPMHVDLTVKAADTLGMMQRDDEAVAILERLEQSPEAPAYVKQWLGYYLLSVPDRVEDAIRYSEEYHRLFPHESDSLFNLAYAYALKYCDELRFSGAPENPASQNRTQALSYLTRALRGQPEYAETVRTKWTQKGEAFSCMSRDTEFRSLVNLEQAAPKVSSAT